MSNRYKLYEGLSWGQLLLRRQLEAIEHCLNSPDFAYMDQEWLMQKRHDVIIELNRVQLEEWNYD